MDQVRIRAAVSAGGLRKGQEVTVAATPQVEGAISTGVYVELERFPADPPPDVDGPPVPPVEDVKLPPEDIPEKRRGRGNS